MRNQPLAGHVPKLMATLYLRHGDDSSAEEAVARSGYLYDRNAGHRTRIFLVSPNVQVRLRILRLKIDSLSAQAIVIMKGSD